MISIVIFLLTTLSGAAVGAYFSDRLTQRCETISAYISLFQSMTAYVTYNGYKLDEMLKARQDTSRCYISDKLIAVSAHCTFKVRLQTTVFQNSQ